MSTLDVDRKDRRTLPPSRFSRIIDNQDGRLIILSAIESGIGFGGNNKIPSELSAYPNGTFVFTECLKLESTGIDTAALNTKGNPLSISTASVVRRTGGKPAIISTRGPDGTGESIRKHGAKGGRLNVYFHDIDSKSSAALRFDARGGKGGDLEAHIKEDGGNGGDGGEVNVIAKLPVYNKAGAIMLRLKDELKLPTEDWEPEEELGSTNVKDGDQMLDKIWTSLDRLQALNNDILNTAILPLRDLVRLQVTDVGGVLKDSSGRPVRSIYRLTANVNKAITMMRRTATAIRSDLMSSVLVQGGEAGKRKDIGLDRGPRGSEGKAGIMAIDVLGPPPALSPFEIPFVFAHPLQCRMVYEKATTYYYLGSSSNRQQAQQLLSTLMDRLSFVTADFVKAYEVGQVEKPLIQAFMKFCGSLESAKKEAQSMRALYKRANDMLIRLAVTDVDYYGYGREWAPRTSYDSLTETTKSALSALERVETTYLAYSKETAVASKLEVHAAGIMSRAQEITKTIDKEVFDMTNAIRIKYEALLDPARAQDIMRARNAAEEAIKGLQNTVSKHFEISPRALFNGLINFASGPNKMLALVQSASLIYEGFTSIPNLSGDPVPKSLLLKQIKMGSDNIAALKEDMLAVSQGKDGSAELNPEYSTKIVTTKQAMDALIDQFDEATFGASSVNIRKTMKAYSDALMQRNKEIVDFNMMLKAITAARAEQKQIEVTTAQMQKGMLSVDIDTSEDLDSVTKLLERMLDVARARVMRVLALMQRALRYTTLSDVDFRDEAWTEHANTSSAGLEEAALSMTSPVLSSMRDRLADQLFDLQEQHGSDVSLFPSDFDKDGVGKLYHLTQEELKELLNTGRTSVRIYAVDQKADSEHERTSEFRSCADVRVYRVRFWLRGLRLRSATGELGAQSEQRRGHSQRLFGNGKLMKAEITHSGREAIVDSLNRRHVFEHEPIKVTFDYRLYPDGSYELDDATGGDIVTFSSKDRKQNSIYSVPSPFTTWTIDLTNSLNTDELDITGVTEAVLEFFGSFRSFKGA